MEVFLSHATADRQLVEHVRAGVSGLGVSVYAAEHDNQAGANLNEKVKSALQRSDLVVVLLTQTGFDSVYVQQEVGAAIGAGKLVIPLVAPPVREFPLGMLNGIEYIDLDPEEPGHATSSLVERISGLARAEAARREAEEREKLTQGIAGLALLIVGVIVLARAE